MVQVLATAPRPSRESVRDERAQVGEVASCSSRGTLTVRASRAVPEGTILTDPEGRFRGRVVRVFGPVAHPYLSVAPRRALSAEQALALVGTPLWTEARRHGA
jgi:rRNA processing protein Gar1